MTSFFQRFQRYRRCGGATETLARLKRSDVLSPSSENSEQIASFRAFLPTSSVRGWPTRPTATALSSQYGEEADRSSESDSESGDRADERRSTAPGRRCRRDGKTPTRRSCLLEYRLDILGVRDPAGARLQTVEAQTTNGQAIADESPTRRSSNHLVSRARRQLSRLPQLPFIISYNCLDVVVNRMTWPTYAAYDCSVNTEVPSLSRV